MIVFKSKGVESNSSTCVMINWMWTKFENAFSLCHWIKAKFAENSSSHWLPMLVLTRRQFNASERHISKGGPELRKTGYEIMQCLIKHKPVNNVVYDCIVKEQPEGNCAKKLWLPVLTNSFVLIAARFLNFMLILVFKILLYNFNSLLRGCWKTFLQWLFFLCLLLS